MADELHHHLKAEYPQGVPGRTAAAGSAKADYAFSYVIPVVVHVMHDNGLEANVTPAQIQSQIDILNEDYNRRGNGFNTHPDGADVQISFCLASTDPDGNPHPGYEYYHYPPTSDIDPYTEDTIMKRTTQWDPTRYMNVWVVRRIYGGQIRGYAYFPDEVAGTIWDGFVVDYRYFGRGTGTAISLGRTGTHEVGHYLGLYHPWGLEENGCFSVGDECDDTPEVQKAHYATYPFCNAPTACDAVTPRQIENYMDYSADGCMNMFSECQADKMRSAILNYRAKLVSAENLLSTGCKEVADTLVAVDDLLLFPVPAKDNLMALPTTSSATSMSYRVFDTRGRLVQSDTIGSGPSAPIAVDLSQMAEGVYVIEVVSGGTTWYKKFIIDR